MKKNKGFMLIETLIVATVVVSTLIFLFVQISTVDKSYDKTFTYNTVNGMYSTRNIRNYILNDGFQILKESLNDESYIDITDCPIEYINYVSYCSMLFDNLNIEKIIFTYEDVTKINVDDLENDMRKFIKSIQHEKKDTNRLIVKFKDNTFASIEVSEEI